MRRWGALLGLLVALLAFGRPAVAAADPPRPLLLIAVPDLRWSDLPAMPVLGSFVAYSSVGVMSVRSEGNATRCGDGLLELSAGTRVPSGVRSCTPDGTTVARLRTHYRHTRYGAHVGTLGDLAGVPATAVGPAAAVVLTGSRGAPVPQAPSVQAAFAAAPTGFVAVVDDGLYGAADRRHAAAQVDRTITQQFKETPPGALVVVAGISDGPTGGPHLHPLLIAGPGWAHRELTSPTTGRAPYVQLFDLTATLLEMRGSTALPSWVSGRVVRVTGNVVPGLSSYADLDRHAGRALTVGHPTFSALCGVLLGVLLFAAIGRRETVWVARWVARLLVLAPVAPALLQIGPWWRWGIAGFVVALVGVAVAGAVVVTLVERRSARLALLVGPALTAAVLLADQLAGAPLQLASPFGDNPLVAGRFHGMGNIDFGLTMSCLLLVTAVAAAAQPARRRALVVIVGLGLLGLVVDVTPALGDDIGGVLALLPAVVVLAALAAGVAVTARRVALVAVVTVLVAVGVAALDYTRPADRQTHAGRFVGQVLHGGAWQVVHRKADAVLASFATPLVTAVVVAAVVVAVLWRRRRALAGVGRAAVAVGIVAVVGSALNDSGVFVAAAALLGLLPPLVATGGLELERGDTRRL